MSYGCATFKTIVSVVIATKGYYLSINDFY